MTTKLTAPIKTPAGEITTIDELAKNGRVEFKEVKNFHSPRSPLGYVTKYFAEIDGTAYCWEISKIAYLSRTGQTVQL